MELGFESLSIAELRRLLRIAVAEVTTAEKEFSEAKKTLALNYKKIAPKGLSYGFTNIDFDQSDLDLKKELIRKIKIANKKAEQIRHMTANLSNLSIKEFTKGFEDSLTASTAVIILRNLGADEDEINEILKNADFNDEDYEEIRDAYNEYKINKLMDEGAEVIPREDAISFFMNRQQ